MPAGHAPSPFVIASTIAFLSSSCVAYTVTSGHTPIATPAAAAVAATLTAPSPPAAALAAAGSTSVRFAPNASTTATRDFSSMTLSLPDLTGWPDRHLKALSNTATAIPLTSCFLTASYFSSSSPHCFRRTLKCVGWAKKVNKARRSPLPLYCFPWHLSSRDLPKRTQPRVHPPTPRAIRRRTTTLQSTLSHCRCECHHCWCHFPPPLCLRYRVKHPSLLSAGVRHNKKSRT